jgi:hypothetical protein
MLSRALFGVAFCAGGLSAQRHLFTLQGDSPNRGDDFGTCIAAAGDVDRDGYADIIIGAWGADRGGQNTGAASVHSGRDGRVLLSWAGDSAGDSFGGAVAGGRDVDRDGYPDLLVGAFFDDANGLESGTVYLFSGRDGRQLRAWHGDDARDKFGCCVAFVTDLNRDGQEDIAVGALEDEGTGFNSGSVTVFSGRDGAVLFRFPGSGMYAQYGYAVASAGDVDGDGYADLIISSPEDARRGGAAGYVDLRSGRDGSRLREFFGLTATYFGISVAGPGDLDGDGAGDVLVGSFHDERSGEAAGSATLFSGRDGRVIHHFPGDPCSQFGRSVAGAGDVDRDGRPDVVIGGPGHPQNGPCAGTVKVYSGRTFGLVDAFYGDGSSHYLGLSVAGVGDVDRDGYADVAGSAVERYLVEASGYVRVYSGAVKSFSTDKHRLSVRESGVQRMWLFAGPEHAGKSYMVLGTFSGTDPGTPLPGGRVLPLNFDAYFQFCVGNPGMLISSGTGRLDASGWADADFHMHPALASLVGTLADHAFVVFGPGLASIDFVSNPAPLTFVH